MIVWPDVNDVPPLATVNVATLAVLVAPVIVRVVGEDTSVEGTTLVFTDSAI